MAVSLIGLVIGSIRKRARATRPTSDRLFVWCLAIWPILVFGLTLWYSLSAGSQPQGRYLFPSIAALALGFGRGVSELAAPLREGSSFATDQGDSRARLLLLLGVTMGVALLFLSVRSLPA